MSQLDLVLAAGIGGYHDDWSESETEEAASAAATEAHSEAHSEDALQELAALHAALPSAPAAATAAMAPSVAAALEDGARIETTEVAGRAVVYVGSAELLAWYGRVTRDASHHAKLCMCPPPPHME